jgi:hypothetical protein
VVLAAADGHGSSSRGGQGAALAVEVAEEFLLDFYQALEPQHRTQLPRVRELMREPVCRKLVQAWAQRVRESVGEVLPVRDVLREYGTTLLAVLFAPEFVLFLQVGDGDLLVVQEDGRVVPGVERHPRNFADETDSLCQPQAWLSAQISVWPPFLGETLVLVSTDGYANSFATHAAFEQIGPDYLARVREQGMAAVLEELEAILEETSLRGSGDDITLGLIHVPPSAAPARDVDTVDAR